MDNKSKSLEAGSGIKKMITLVQLLNHATNNDAKNDCKRCGKIVYFAELCRLNGEPYHRTCFTCKECNKSLSTASYNTHGGELYCTHHLREAHRGSNVKRSMSLHETYATRLSAGSPLRRAPAAAATGVTLIAAETPQVPAQKSQTANTASAHQGLAFQSAPVGEKLKKSQLAIQPPPSVAGARRTTGKGVSEDDRKADRDQPRSQGIGAGTALPAIPNQEDDGWA